MPTYNVYRRRRLLDDDPHHHHGHSNSWLDKLASPASILTATIAAFIVVAVLVQYYPSKNVLDAYELGRIAQNSKWLFASNFALLFSVAYPFLDQAVDIIWVYQSNKISTPANVVQLNENNDLLMETSFLAERFITCSVCIVLSSITLFYMDPSKDPVTLLFLLNMRLYTSSILKTGILLSVLRQSSKICTSEITIFILLSTVSASFAYVWSASFALNVIMSLINMLALFYPMLLSLREYYFNDNQHDAESLLPSDEIDNKKEKFESRFVILYYLFALARLYVFITRFISRDESVYGFGQVNDFTIFIFGSAVVTPLFILVCNPKRLYQRYQEKKIKLLYIHSIQLLESLLPGKVIAHFRVSKEPFVEKFDFATVLFADIMDYTVVCQLLTPSQIVFLLSDIFCQFDNAAKARGVYRVETIGDCYMASSGCPDAEDPSVAAERMARFAQDILQIVQSFQPPFDLGFPIQIRIGIHSGPVVAGTLSGKMPRYCLFGDTVNTASRMESTGEVGRIHLSEDTVSLVRKGSTCSHEFESRLPMHVKGKGVMSTYFLDSPEHTVFALDVHSLPMDLRSRPNSTADEPEPHLLLRNFSSSLYLASMGQTPNPNSRQPRVAPMTSDSVSDKRRKWVVPSDENDLDPNDLELGGSMVANPTPSAPKDVVANPTPSAHTDMAFVMASSLLSWEFDVQNIISKDMLIDISFMLFQISWLCGPLGVSEVTLRNFIENVAGSYHRKSFHNLQHAVSVLHTTWLLTNYCNQKRSDAIIGYGTIPSLARFALMIGALVHDCDHPGHTNSFEVNTNSSLAQQYGNIAVLEHHHLAVAESILSKPGCNILETFNEETATMFKDLLKYIVLGTDMSLHKDIVSEMEIFDTDEIDTEKKCNATMFTLSRIILHAADLSNPVRAFGICKAWAIRLADEHTKQVQAEEALDLQPAQFMVHTDTLSVYRGEIQFLTYVAQPLWAAMAKMWPQLSGLYEQLHLNIQMYRDIISKASEDNLRISTKSGSISTRSGSFGIEH